MVGGRERRSWKGTRLGEPRDVLELLETERPEVKEGEVLIEVEASSLNFFDILLCQGKYQENPPLPFTPGAEISGIIREDGGTSGIIVGQRVSATPPIPVGGVS
ncbi:NADPH:quinone oxidoreductase family protein, partial [Bacilli bacterium]